MKMMRYIVCLNWGLNGGLNAMSFRPGHVVYASSGTPGGGSENPTEITLDELEDRLLELEDQGNLSTDITNKAVAVLRHGSERKKRNLLWAAKLLLAGKIDQSVFELRIPVLTNPEQKKPEKTGAPETTAAPEVTEVPSQEVANIRKRTAEQVLSLYTSAREARITDGSIPEEVREKLNGEIDRIVSDLEKLNTVDKHNNDTALQKVQEQTTILQRTGIITADQAAKILKLDATDEDYAAQLRALTQGAQSPESRYAVEEIDKIFRELALRDQKIIEDLHQIMERFERLSEETDSVVSDEHKRRQAIKSLERETGVTIRPGQKITYYQITLDEKGEFKKYLEQDAEITKIRFIDQTTPLIFVNAKDPDTGELTEYQLSPKAFADYCTHRGVTDLIADQNELHGHLGYSLKPGLRLEYSYLTGDTGENDVDASCQIREIRDGNIIFDQPLKIGPRATPSDTLTFGEYLVFARRYDALPAIESIEELRAGLLKHNQDLNSRYQRTSEDYPPILLEEGEVLYMDDKTGRMYTISKIENDGITLDNGDKHTLTGFLRWVKKNEIEKFSPKAQAERAAKNLGLGDEDQQALLAAKEQEENAQKNSPKTAEGKEGEADKMDETKKQNAGPSVSYWRILMSETRVMSISHFIDMYKTTAELVKRKMKRWKNEGVGKVGQALTQGILNGELSNEFDGYRKASEKENVGKIEEYLKTLSNGAIKKVLRNPPTRDHLTAAISVLSEKGHMRWDDPAFWRAVERFTFDKIKRKGEDKPIRIGDPDPSTHIDDLKLIFETWWQKGKFKSMQGKALEGYKNGVSSYTSRFERLALDPDAHGGLGGEMRKLLAKHIVGSDPNPMNFECFLERAIFAGKMNVEDRIFMLIMAAGIKNPDGLTLLSPERVSALVGERFKSLPYLDFLTDPETIRVDEGGHPIPDPQNPGQYLKGTPNFNNFQQWVRELMPDVKDKNGNMVDVIKSPQKIKEGMLKPGNATFSFITRKMASSEAVHTRIEKAGMDAGNWDHDDMQILAPLLKENMVEQLYLRQSGGKLSVSVPGLRNALLGFNHFMRTKLEAMKDSQIAGNTIEAKKELRNFMELTRSFLKLDGTLDGRLNHGRANVVRLSEGDYQRAPGTDPLGRPLRVVVDEVRGYIQNLSAALDRETQGRLGLTDLWQKVVSKGVEPGVQSKAYEAFIPMLEGAMTEVAQDRLYGIMFELQYGADGQKQFISGMDGVARKKSQTPEEDASKYNLHGIRNQHRFVDKVREIEELQRELNLSAAEILAARGAKERIDEARLQEIISGIKQGKVYGREEDFALLEAEKQRLLTQKRQRENSRLGRGSAARHITGRPSETPTENGGNGDDDNGGGYSEAA